MIIEDKPFRIRGDFLLFALRKLRQITYSKPLIPQHIKDRYPVLTERENARHLYEDCYCFTLERVLVWMDGLDHITVNANDLFGNFIVGWKTNNNPLFREARAFFNDIASGELTERDFQT